MRIVSWNSHFGFNQEKAQYINKYEADIYVIQECSKQDVDKLKSFKKYSIWYGDNIDSPHGIALFSDNNYLQLLEDLNKDFRYVIPFKIYGGEFSFVLFAVWTKNNDKEKNKLEYTVPTWQAINYKEYNKYLLGSVILIGDFNSNNTFKYENGTPSHNDIIYKLKEYKIESAYHKFKNIENGKESEPTLLWNYNKDSKFHIDYCFLSEDFLIENFQIESVDEWEKNKISDHCPIIIDMKRNSEIIIPTEEIIKNCDRDLLWEKYRNFYEIERKEYEKIMKPFADLEQKNKHMPLEIEEKITKALLIQEYKIAKTLPHNPHQYCLRNKWFGDTSFDEIVELMREYGYIEKFYTRYYPMFNIGEYKYWTMGYPLEVTTLINCTTIEKLSFNEFCDKVRR